MEGLRVALTGYRSDPRSGGQGVYVRNLATELGCLGHEVTVLSGPPYPDLHGTGARLVRVPSLELYEPGGPFRNRAWARVRAWPDVVEFSQMFFGRFPEPLTFTMRVERLLAPHRDRFDVVHDNQSLGSGLLDLQAAGWPVLATIHHPLTVDLALALDHIDDPRWIRSTLRWYAFIEMQKRVAGTLPSILTVSEASRSDIADQMGVPRSNLSVVPVGADPDRFRPRPHAERIPGRCFTTASADVPLKGLVPMLEALALLRERQPHAHLVVLARKPPEGPVAEAMARLALEPHVEFLSGLSDAELVAELSRSEVAVVPSLYEGFSLPAVEAMACGVPLVATTGGALPEVVGPDGGAGLLVAPGDPAALATAIGRLLVDPALRARVGEAGRRRVLERFTWRHCAEATVERYRDLLLRAPRTVGRCEPSGSSATPSPTGRTARSPITTGR
jgi:glycosyltransferase involved in cell wall biosynthesis